MFVALVPLYLVCNSYGKYSCFPAALMARSHVEAANVCRNMSSAIHGLNAKMEAMSRCIYVARKACQACSNGCIRKQDRVVLYTVHIDAITVDADRRPLFVLVAMVVVTIAMSKTAMFAVSVLCNHFYFNKIQLIEFALFNFVASLTFL